MDELRGKKKRTTRTIHDKYEIIRYYESIKESYGRGAKQHVCKHFNLATASVLNTILEKSVCIKKACSELEQTVAAASSTAASSSSSPTMSLLGKHRLPAVRKEIIKMTSASGANANATMNNADRNQAPLKANKTRPLSLLSSHAVGPSRACESDAQCKRRNGSSDECRPVSSLDVNDSYNNYTDDASEGDEQLMNDDEPYEKYSTDSLANSPPLFDLPTPPDTAAHGHAVLHGSVSASISETINSSVALNAFQVLKHFFGANNASAQQQKCVDDFGQALNQLIYSIQQPKITNYFHKI